MRDDELPLAGVVVLDFSQFLAGPVAALRLADLGARVIKIERPVTGEIGRTLAFAGRWADEDTVSFHAMNRNKEAVVADLKDPADLERVKRLVARADVLLHNFRPGVMERIGLDHESARALNPALVYAAASGYGAEGPWSTRPGQDLLAQSVSGLAWTTGQTRPVTVGLSLADHLLSCHLAQGITALLVRKAHTGQGGLIESSLLEAMLDLQTAPLTTRLNTPTGVPLTTGLNTSTGAPLTTGLNTSTGAPLTTGLNAPAGAPLTTGLNAPAGAPLTTRLNTPTGAHEAAPRGDAFDVAADGERLLAARLYRTADGYLAIAAVRLADLVGVLQEYGPPADRELDEGWVAQRLASGKTAEWVEVLGRAGVECAPLRTLDEVVASAEFEAVGMTQEVVRPAVEPGGTPLRLTTTRSPIRIDGEVLRNGRAAPRLGAQGYLRDGVDPLRGRGPGGDREQASSYCELGDRGDERGS